MSAVHFILYSHSAPVKDPAKSIVFSSFLERWEGLHMDMVKKTVPNLWILVCIYKLDFGIWQNEAVLLWSWVFLFDFIWVSLVSLIQKTQSFSIPDAYYKASKPMKYRNNSPPTIVSSRKPEETAIVIYFASPAAMIKCTWNSNDFWIHSEFI